MNKSSDRALLHSAVDSLGSLGFEAMLESKGVTTAGNVVISLRQGGKSLRYRVDVQRALRPSLIGPISLSFSEGRDDRLLITDYVTPPVADLLRARGIQFVDAAGNAYLKRGGLLIFVTGRRSVVPQPAIKVLRVFRPTGLKTIFALVSVPDLVSAPQRDIARAAGVALGSVAQVLEGLRELGFLTEIRGTRHLLDRGRLITQLTEAYVRLLHPRLELSRFAAPSSGWWRHAELTRYSAQWGGETAAALLQDSVVPECAILYAEKTPAGMLSKHHLKADPDGRVVLRRRFWHFDVDAPRTDVVPSLLIYADLVAVGDGRSLAVAKQIRDAYLD